MSKRNPQFWGESECRNCGLVFQYRYSQKNGFYCSRQCCGEHIGKERFREGTDYRSRTLRKYLFRERGKQCEVCDQVKVAKGLEIHHIDGDQTNNERGNLQVVCLECHELSHNHSASKLSPEGRARCNNATSFKRKGVAG